MHEETAPLAAELRALKDEVAALRQDLGRSPVHGRSSDRP